MTHLCVPIFVTEGEKAISDVSDAVKAGADMVELRTDKIDDPSLAEALVSVIANWLRNNAQQTKIIETRRSTSEGGFSGLLEEEAWAVRRTAGLISQNVDYIDLELAILERHPSILKHIRKPFVLSAHNISAKPANLDDLVKAANNLPSSVNKFVWKAQNILDNLSALKLLKGARRPTIALCMGEEGLISRVLAKKFGAFLTFASLNAESATAPGQITIKEIKHLYRWDSIKSTTEVFGVVAYPVRHSLSPTIHNAAFEEKLRDAIYLPMLVEPGYQSFKSFIEGFRNFEGMNLSGLSVTIPHKENALRYLKETGSDIEPLGERIGAINTIKINQTGKLFGENTDYAAILDSITEALGIDRDHLKGLRVAVVGAGGTGRTAVAAQAHYGAKVIVSNRSRERAQSLAEEFNNRCGRVSASSLDRLCGSEFDVFINTTSIGMFPKIDESPLADFGLPFSTKTVVFDAIYNPIKTRLLREAEAAGSKIIGGVEMFVRQAAAQFKTWTGQAAPLDRMRKVIEEKLGEASISTTLFSPQSE